MNTNQMGTGSMTASDHLKSDIDELVPDMVAFRRDLHAHPELAYEEVRTSGLVAQRLSSLGLQVQTGAAKTGVVGLLRGGKLAKSENPRHPRRYGRLAHPRIERDRLSLHSRGENACLWARWAYRYRPRRGRPFK